MIRLVTLCLIAGMLWGCAPQTPTNYQPTAVEQALTGSLYRGEWRDGFLYEVTFSGAGAEMTAEVHVIDSDAARTEYTMPARVSVDGNGVTLTFTEFDRVDHLVFDPAEQRLDGYTVFKGEAQNRNTWAELVTR